MLGEATYPILVKAEKGIADKVPENRQADFNKVVHAGLTIMYSSKLKSQRDQRLAQTTDPVKDASEGATRLITNLYLQSKKTIDGALITPATMTFAIEYLDLVGKAGMAEITPELLDQVIAATGDAIMAMLPQDKVKAAIASANNAQAPQQAPQGMQQGMPPVMPQTPQPIPQGIIAAGQGA